MEKVKHLMGGGWGGKKIERMAKMAESLFPRIESLGIYFCVLGEEAKPAGTAVIKGFVICQAKMVLI